MRPEFSAAQKQMTKAEHIEYWKESAERNWPGVGKMFESELHLESLFWANLKIEKLIKAHWVKDNESNHHTTGHF